MKKNAAITGASMKRRRKNCADLVRVFRTTSIEKPGTYDRHIATIQRHAGFKVTGR